MIHFFFTYTDDASNTPFVHALAESGIAHEVYTRELDFSYQHRAQLLLLRIPKLVWYSLKSVRWSLWRSRSGRPDIVIPVSHLQALLFLLARALVRRRYSIVLLGFIYTKRKGWLLSWLRKRYFTALLQRMDGIICHSEIEVTQYADEFGCPQLLRFVPLGLNVQGHQTDAAFRVPGSSYALSAGRSGRDYGTLCAAFSGINHPLRIICDNKAALAGAPLTPNIQILDHCFAAEYLEQLRGADIVVVPIAVDDISAGQMVIIQAMALRKPIVTTRTATIGHYVKHDWNGLLVESGNADDIQQNIRRLVADPALGQRLANNAYQTFLDSFSMPAFARAVVATAQALHALRAGAQSASAA